MAGKANTRCLHHLKDLQGMNDPFLNKVFDTIEQFDMFTKSERLLVCLSGGADSVSLLLCLKMLGYNICACHVNHQLRGDESERDQHFCEELCKKLEIELTVQRINVNEFCKEHAVSIEEGARKMRYRIFDQIKADKICTAHSLSDCIETTVFNLARGTGLKGLCSIPPKRDNIVRPLINCTREDIIGFLERNGQDFVTDSTNLTDEYTRNRIRHNIIPQLEQLNSSLMKSYENTLSYLRNDMIYLEKSADMAYAECCDGGQVDTDKYFEYDKCIRDRLLIRLLNDNGLDASHDMIGLMSGIIENDGKLNISKDYYFVCKNRKAYITKQSTEDMACIDPVDINSDGEYLYGKRKISFKSINMADIDCEYPNVHKMFANCCLDCDKIIGGLVLRKRSEGDRIHLVNRSGDVSIRKLLKNSFPLEKRSQAVIIYDDAGAVFVEGSGVSERVKITEKTKRVLTFAIEYII